MQNFWNLVSVEDKGNHVPFLQKRDIISANSNTWNIDTSDAWTIAADSP